jgi:hypothetical protein
MRDLVPGFPVSLPACASRTPALKGYALLTGVATREFRRVAVFINILTSNAAESWQALLARALFPVRGLRRPLDWLSAHSTHKTARPKVAVLPAAFIVGTRTN